MIPWRHYQLGLYIGNIQAIGTQMIKVAAMCSKAMILKLFHIKVPKLKQLRLIKKKLLLGVSLPFIRRPKQHHLLKNCDVTRNWADSVNVDIMTDTAAGGCSVVGGALPLSCRFVHFTSELLMPPLLLSLTASCGNSFCC